MIFKWRPVRFRASVAGGIRCAHAYHPSTRGSATTFGLRKNWSRFILTAKKARYRSWVEWLGAARPQHCQTGRIHLYGGKPETRDALSRIGEGFLMSIRP